MSARRPIFNHLVAPLAGGGPVSHVEAKRLLDEYRAEVLREAIEAVKGEHLHDNTGVSEDEAYDGALHDARSAIHALIEGGAR